MLRFMVIHGDLHGFAGEIVGEIDMNVVQDVLV